MNKNDSEPLWRRPIDIEELNRIHEKTAVAHLGIRFTAVGSRQLSASMPVDERTVQPFGILHGGAMVLLAETLGSCAAACSLDDNKRPVGLDINANHLRSVYDGEVHGTCEALHIGRSTQVWQIEIRDQQQHLCCVSRLTIAVLER